MAVAMSDAFKIGGLTVHFFIFQSMCSSFSHVLLRYTSASLYRSNVVLLKSKFLPVKIAVCNTHGTRNRQQIV